MHRCFRKRIQPSFSIAIQNQQELRDCFLILFDADRLVETKNSDAQLILPTIGCINENLLAETNAQLFSYNSIIRKVANEFNCILADTSEKFQAELSRRKTQDYCMENFQSTAFFDSISCSLGLADRLSKKRKLHLTIDGVHLNSKGAIL